MVGLTAKVHSKRSSKEPGRVEDDCTGDIMLDEFDLDVDWIFVVVEDASDLFIVSGITLGKVTAERLQTF